MPTARPAARRLADSLPAGILNTAWKACDPAAKANARDSIKGATPAAREAICPAGYSGKCRQTFIAHGLLADEQSAADKLSTALTTKETTMPTTTEAKPARRSRASQPRPSTKQTARRSSDSTEGISAAQVARDNELDARKFRAFLRSNDMPRQFARKADATKAVKAFRKAS
jgi:hypothetical protein